MKTKVLFEEVQKQNQKWIWFLVISLNITLIIAFIQQQIFGLQFGNYEMPVWVYLIMFAILGTLFFFLIGSNLHTRITANAITFRFAPFHGKDVSINKEEISDCYVRIYRPMAEYGGWGMRTAFNGKNGKAYNVSGKIGIQLELKDGRRILIGTRKYKEAEAAVNQFKSQN